MRKLDLCDIQQQSLCILKDIHSFCKSRNIKYSLAYGTLLGAVRHKGFIPWDDDIDIMMTRPEYEKFCKLYTSNCYKLICSDNDDSCMIAFARVCDMHKTIALGSNWTKQASGIWIDVFPIDGAEDEYFQFDYRYQKARKQWKKLLRNREIAGGESPIYSKKMNILIKVLKNLNLLFINGAIEKFRRDKIIRNAKSICFGSTDHISQLTCYDDAHRVPYPTAVFDGYEEITFEDDRFMVACGYKQILSSDFGDYMKLPPESQRVPKQGNITFMWK